MRIIISLLVLICGLQHIFARSVPGFSWTGGNYRNVRPYWSTYDDDELFGLSKTIDGNDDEYKNFVAAILGEDDETTEKVIVINDKISSQTNENDKTTSDYGFHIENLESSEETETVQDDKDDESKEASGEKGLEVHWSFIIDFAGNKFSTDYDAATKSSEETKDDHSLNTADANLNTSDVDLVLSLILGGSKSSEEKNEHSGEKTDILKEMDELFKELGIDDNTKDDDDEKDDDSDEDGAVEVFVIKDGDNTNKNVDNNEGDDYDDDNNNDDNNKENTDDILKEIDELFKVLGINDKDYDNQDAVNVVLIDNDDNSKTHNTSDDNNNDEDTNDDDNTDNNNNNDNKDNNTDVDNNDNKDNNNDNKINNDDSTSSDDDDYDNFQISFISLDDNTQNTLDNNIYDVNPTTDSISKNNIFYNANSNPKYDFELINTKGKEQKQPLLDDWDLKSLLGENIIDNRNDILSQKLNENFIDYLKIRSNFMKLTETLQQKEQNMDMDFLLSMDDPKEKLSKFDHDISDVYKTVEDLKQDTMELQKLQQNVYLHNLLKDVLQGQFKNNAEK